MDAGIYWDPREPQPPECRAPTKRAVVDSNYVAFGHAADHALPRGFMPPLSTALSAQVVHDTAKMTAKQHFCNTTNATICKASYTFPLPEGCSIVSFTCRVGNKKMLNAKVKPRSAAWEEFDQAVKMKSTAALLEQKTTEIFTISLGNIPTNTRVKTEIAFITVLKHRLSQGYDIVALTIPTFIAPRHGSPPVSMNPPGNSGAINVVAEQGWTRDSGKTRPFQTPGAMHITVEVVAKDTVRQISSMTHNIVVEKKLGRQTCETWDDFVDAGNLNPVTTSLVRLASGFIFLDRDFILDIAMDTVQGMEAPTAWLESHPSLESHKALMLNIPANFALQNSYSYSNREILLVADRSGSMTDKIPALQSAMTFFLKGLPVDCLFNIWCFGDTFTSLWGKSQEYTEKTLQNAIDFVKTKFSADMGGTELLPALQEIIKQRDNSPLTDVIVLTDGEVWRLDETLEFVRKTRMTSEARVRFFSLGIGEAVSHALVEGIAKLGGGYSEIIPPLKASGWEDRLVTMLAAATKGHISNLRVDFGEALEKVMDKAVEHPEYLNGGPLRDQTCTLQSPSEISSLSPFFTNRVYLLFEIVNGQMPPEFVTIKAASADGQELATKVPVMSIEKRDATIHKLAARATLGDLEQKLSQLHHSHPSTVSFKQQEVAIASMAERIACQWSLVSKWTSLYAVEEPFDAGSQDPDDFMDKVESSQKHKSLDLLCPRLGQRRLKRPSQSGLPYDMPSSSVWEEPNDEDSGLSESSESEPDSKLGFGYREDNDDGDDDPGSLGDFVGNHRGSGGDDQPESNQQDGDSTKPGRNNTSSSTRSTTGSNRSHTNGEQDTSRRLSTRTANSEPVGCCVYQPENPVGSHTRSKKRRLDLGYQSRRRLSRIHSTSSVARPEVNPAIVQTQSYSPHLYSPPQPPFQTYEAYDSSRMLEQPLSQFQAHGYLGTAEAYSSPSSLALEPPRMNHICHKLITFQSFDGSFKFDTPFTMRKLLDLHFCELVRELTTKCKSFGHPVKFAYRLGLAMGLMTLLEERYPQDRKLWRLMNSKAHSFARQSLTASQMDSLLMISRGALDQGTGGRGSPYGRLNSHSTAIELSQSSLQSYNPTQNTTELAEIFAEESSHAIGFNEGGSREID